jgi:hypothetical protein
MLENYMATEYANYALQFTRDLTIIKPSNMKFKIKFKI